jgi:two-component system, sensor histidine kinase and response regulator
MSKPMILCVDDEKMILTSLKEQLKRHFADSYRIETVESGEEALEIIEELQAEAAEMPVVICDHIMPGMRGDELLRHIHNALPKTLKILLTGQADADAVGNAINHANLYRYIAKPWEQDDLTLTVTEAIRSYYQDKKLAEQNAILQQMNRELEQFNETLELQVKERTAELEAQQIELKNANEKLHELNASKDKFFSIISHDLRSPFNTLLGFAQLLSDNLDRYDTAQVNDNVNKIRNSAERLYALLENLLTWSRIQRGVMEHFPEVLDLYEIVEDNLELFTPHAEQKGVALHSRIQENTCVYADHSMVDTIIRNLTSNALKFTPSGGNITISAESHNAGLQVTVADTGLGIPEDVLPCLLRLDRQYSAVGTAGETGTGLGLILCKELVEKNCGTIWIESVLNKGSTFCFTLPTTANVVNPGAAMPMAGS